MKVTAIIIIITLLPHYNTQAPNMCILFGGISLPNRIYIFIANFCPSNGKIIWFIIKILYTKKDIDGEIYEANCALTTKQPGKNTCSGETQSKMSKLWKIENISAMHSTPQLCERNHLWIIIWSIWAEHYDNWFPLKQSQTVWCHFIKSWAIST